ncbi:hypothetical protein KDW55_08875 [Burkholderia sp. AU19243]|uniref:hypothetical protein n=1 Tax=Burkholderia sp. AU19243 TaxID=2824810 RepID=UPI001B95FF20|nr:hypothetical protein [Burkholderia sp. AU19243]MBR8363436.1 hypothetical protein [Burkholderia sp. AU19243]
MIATGFEEGQVRDCVADVIDALIDIGDVTVARLDGRTSLVLSRPIWVNIGDAAYVALGNTAKESMIAHDYGLYARLASTVPATVTPVHFSDWLGPAAFHSHIVRRVGSQAGGTISEFWDVLKTVLRYKGNPIDPTQLRAVVASPHATGFFGRPNADGVSGRWVASVPNGTWCGVRPGRNPNEWHPVVACVDGCDAHALDLYDWDEWNWALLARGVALGAPERSTWQNGVLAFEYPIPAQFIRALRLLGVPGRQAWTWQVSEKANHCFDEWCRAEI